MNTFVREKHVRNSAAQTCHNTHVCVNQTIRQTNKYQSMRLFQERAHKTETDRMLYGITEKLDVEKNNPYFQYFRSPVTLRVDSMGHKSQPHRHTSRSSFTPNLVNPASDIFW